MIHCEKWLFRKSALVIGDFDGKSLRRELIIYTIVVPAVFVIKYIYISDINSIN